MDIERYRSLFIGEMRELIDRVVGVLGAAERGSSPVDVDELFRCFHSMKSMSASMDAGDAAGLARAAEDLLQAARSEGTFSGEWSIIFQRTAERLDAMVDAFSSGAPAPDCQDLSGALRAAAAAAASGGRGEVASGGDAGVVREQRNMQPVLRIEVRLDPEARMPAARAYMVVRKLKELGRVAGSEPSERELKDPASRPESITVLLADEPPDYRIRSVLAGIPETELRSIASIGPHLVPSPGRGRKLPVRVMPELLDSLHELGGELFFLCRQFESLRPVSAGGAYDDALRTFRRTVKDLQQAITDARLVPLDLVTATMPIKVRELAAQLGKQARLEISGDSIGIDRAIAERLEAPLMHLLRNSIDHGIEYPGKRAEKGKPECGLIRIDFSRTDNGLRIEFSDDGGGIDVEAIRRVSLEKGIVTNTRARGMCREELLEMPFLPGFSTVAVPTDLSGRGVGLDVVRRTMGEVGGRVTVESEADRGSRFIMDMPASFMQMHALIVETGGGVWAVPIPQIREVAGSSGLSPAGMEDGLYMFGGEPIKVADLDTLLRLGSAQCSRGGLKPWIIMIEAQGRRLGLGVEGILGESQLVLRQLGAPLDMIRGLSSYSILPDGRPVLTLDLAFLAGREVLDK
jgi:two-component system chemotaxis sensor kinase CheA